VISEHASKLQAAHNNYDHTEMSLAQLAHNVTLPGAV
jgi:hypothetical protein